MKANLPISVVIATLGGDTLKTTIAQICRGICVPSEILVCIPKSESSGADCVATVPNVRIIRTPCRGQVAQRAVGLVMAAYPFVMQLDDDIVLQAKTLKILYEVLIAKGEGNVVAPFLRLNSTGEGVTSYVEDFRGFLRNCHASLVCGAKFGKKRMGTISPAGIGFGIPLTSGDSPIVESEWLPGGATLCYKDDLIIDNYYPFSGKAFSEDLIHSVLWRNNGCRLWTVQNVSALVDVTSESFNWTSVLSRYKAHAYVAKLSGGNIWRSRLWFVFYCLWNTRKLIADNRLRK